MSDVELPSIITAISVRGMKSIAEETRIGLTPLTVLAGANSSGKTSLLQSVLLLKQTLEANFEPDGLLLNGPNVHFSDGKQVLSHLTETNTFSIGLSLSNKSKIEVEYRRSKTGSLEIKKKTKYDSNGRTHSFNFQMSKNDLLESDKRLSNLEKTGIYRIQLMKNRWLLFPTVSMNRQVFENTEIVKETASKLMKSLGLKSEIDSEYTEVISKYQSALTNIIHVPAIRGNPLRTYQTTGYIQTFLGTFDLYVASVIRGWKSKREHEKLKTINENLEYLELAKAVRTRKSDATQTSLEIKLSRPSTASYYNIADVGFGVSQVLPVITALISAQPGQLVFIEQPEIHLHPRAQYRLATILVEAVNRGVRMVIETHSSLLILGIQTLVAQKKLDSKKVALHWFKLDKQGKTKVDSAILDKNGSFGDWDQDFGSVEMEAQKGFLDAFEERVIEDE